MANMISIMSMAPQMRNFVSLQDPLSMTFQFDNSYLTLDNGLFAAVMPTAVSKPSVAIFNYMLAKDLGLDTDNLSDETISAYLSGNRIIKGSEPIAQAYAGHQFGHFNKLGDGRAILLGEHLTPAGKRFDIQLKGSGVTPYSRRGDGKATLSAMLREYVISEAMYFLHIPTTRSLAVVHTGEKIYRETITPSAVLTRVAASHIRVGTFQYVRNFHSEEILKEFTNYTIQRHYPDLINAENPPLALLEKVMHEQIALIADWMRVGFIHGVMNTDNMSIAGETIDYGPCAFINVYNPDTVFSSIDQQGRYAFANQSEIALWNITRFAESLLPLIDKNTEAAIRKATAVLDTFAALFDEKWLGMMGRKIGITDIQTDDMALISRLLEWMYNNQADYTNTFIGLSVPGFNTNTIYQQPAFTNWLTDWKKRIGAENGLSDTSRMLMQKHNPVYIPRNHQVELALKQAQENSDYTEFKKMLEILSDPYNYQHMDRDFQNPPVEEQSYKTYCGT